MCIMVCITGYVLYDVYYVMYNMRLYGVHYGVQTGMCIMGCIMGAELWDVYYEMCIGHVALATWVFHG